MTSCGIMELNQNERKLPVEAYSGVALALQQRLSGGFCYASFKNYLSINEHSQISQLINHQSFDFPINQSINQAIGQSVNRSINQDSSNRYIQQSQNLNRSVCSVKQSPVNLPINQLINHDISQHNQHINPTSPINQSTHQSTPSNSSINILRCYPPQQINQSNQSINQKCRPIVMGPLGSDQSINQSINHVKSSLSSPICHSTCARRSIID